MHQNIFDKKTLKLNYVNVLNSAVKRLIVINRIQNKFFVYIMCILKYI